MTDLKVFGNTYTNVKGIKATDTDDAIVTFGDGGGVTQDGAGGILFSDESKGSWTAEEIEQFAPSGDIVSTNPIVRQGAYYRSAITSYTNTVVTALSNSNVFEGCTNLTSVHLPALTTMSTVVFAGCSSLQFIALPSLATITSYNNFQNTGLITADFGNLTTLRTFTFNGSSSLRNIVLRKNGVTAAENWTSQTFAGIYSHPTESTIYVPENQITAYQTASNWSNAYAAGVTFAKIEGTYYETHYADGTEIPT